LSGQLVLSAAHTFELRAAKHGNTGKGINLL
jgi:hypothetical protein